MAERRVIWAGTAAPSPVRDYLRAIAQTPVWTDWNMRHLVTHRAGSQLAKWLVFARAATVLAVTLVFRRPDVVHIHAVDKTGSRSRGALLAWMAWLARVPVVFQVHPMNQSRPAMRLPVPVDAVVVTGRPGATELDALYRQVTGRH